MLSFWFVIIINFLLKIKWDHCKCGSTFSIPKLLCRILNEYSNGCPWKSVFIWVKWHEPFIKHVENGNQERRDTEGGTKYTSIDDEDLNKAEKVIQSWSDNTTNFLEMRDSGKSVTFTTLHNLLSFWTLNKLITMVIFKCKRGQIKM